MIRWKSALKLLIVSFLTIPVVFANGGDERTLQEIVFENYNRDVHPIRQGSKSQTVMVTFDVQVIRIIKVSERDQFIQAYLWINQYWNNPYLTWNPKDYGGVTSIHVLPDRVWVPDIVLYNNVDSNGQLGGGTEVYKRKVSVWYDGNNTWLNPVIFKSICRIDVSYFPFDDQICKLKFGSWAFDGSKIDMRAPKATSALNNYYIPNGEWQLISISSKRNELKYQCCPVPFVDITVTVNLRRHALNYTLTLIIPCALLSSLVFLGFILPPESGERIGLSITVLLSVTVFQQLTSQLMPSYDFPYLAQYYLATILQTGFSLVVTTLILNFYHRSQRNMPWIMRKVVLDWLAPVLFCHLCKKQKKTDYSSCPTSPRSASEPERSDQLHEIRVDWPEKSPYGKRSCPKPIARAHLVERRYENGSSAQFTGPPAGMPYSPKHSNSRIRGLFRSRKSNLQTSMVGQSLRNAGLTLLSEGVAKQGVEVFEEQRKELMKKRAKEWLKAARVLDRFFLIMFILTSTITLVIIFFRAPRFNIGH